MKGLRKVLRRAGGLPRSGFVQQAVIADKPLNRALDLKMNIEQEIQNAFFKGGEPVICDEFIRSNEDVMWIKEEVDLAKYVPSYMYWVARNGVDENGLVSDHTLAALAEYGRCKDSSIKHLNFKYLCSLRQKEVVINFLKWCQTNLLISDGEQVSRAIKQWCRQI